MSKKLNPNIIRIGDKVKIIKPFIFIRCGYPMSKKDIKESLSKEKLDLLENFVYNFTGLTRDVFTPNYRADNIIDKVKDQLAFGILVANGFGGNTRSIHSKERPELLNITGVVRTRRVVRTGVHERGSRDQETGYYDPSYLGNVKSHIIFGIDIDLNYDMIGFIDDFDINIEGINLEKIHEE